MKLRNTIIVAVMTLLFLSSCNHDELKLAGRNHARNWHLSFKLRRVETWPVAYERAFDLNGGSISTDTQL